jgi:MFS transporter, OCT family, solute carrier family 22 (organic cation transporter), member 4/5
MAFDELLVHLGEFGRYQKRIYLLLCLPAISCALHKLAWVFLAAKAKHRYSLFAILCTLFLRSLY